MLTLRVRGKDGTARVQVPRDGTVLDIKKAIAQQLGLPVEDQLVTVDPQHTRVVGEDTATVQKAGLEHGSMVFVKYSHAIQEGAIPTTERSSEYLNKGKLKDGELRGIKKHWTYAEFCAHVDAKQVVIKTQKEAHCSMVTVEFDPANTFQTYLREFAFQRQRVGICYGYFTEANGIVVEAIYEPHQSGTMDTFEVLDDECLATADRVAEHLGYERVGWIVSHHPRDHVVSALEVVQASKFQAECENPAFATVTVSCNEKGDVQFEAYQMSDVAVEIAKEDGWEAPSAATKCKTKKTPIVSDKEAEDIEVEFFLVNVALDPTIRKETNLHNGFPVENRPEFPQSPDDLRNYMVKNKSKTLLQKLSDFHLLVYLARMEIFSLTTDIPVICTAIEEGDSARLEGYGMILDAFVQ